MNPGPRDPPSPSGLRIQLLGSFAVRAPGRAAAVGQWRLRKARALVMMLALAPGQACHRDQILDRLWPELEPAAAARNLHQTLYIARRTLAALGAATENLLVLQDERVLLDAGGPVEIDVLEFERLAAVGLAPGGDASLRTAAELYAGDLQPDPADAQWLTTRRDELRAVHHEVMIKLASSVRHQAPEEALVLLTRLREADPLHEGAARAHMQVLADLGRRSEALARYEQLVDDLLEEFGTDPDPQTTGLFRELLTTSTSAQRPHPRAGDAGEPIGSLPVPVSSFIGRERELADVDRLLDHARLLTLTGAGGCGKTRLAIEAARKARGRYPDGAWFVDLAGVAEAPQVATAVAAALALDPGTGSSQSQALVDQLRGRAMLIVLDNCEHVLGSCAQLVAALLSGCPGVVVLATSRAPLHAPGEYTFRVPSLALPAPVHTDAPDLAELARQSSVRLFVERTGQVRTGFTLTADNARAISELCRRLDGIPLALELAAAKTAVLEPAEIVQRLGDALDLLRGAPGGVTRHQTLRGTLEWSHDLLTDPEQILLRRLSIFAAGFTLEAMEAVCADARLPREDLFDLLATLVDQSLVVTHDTGLRTRYGQLETVRQFGRECLRQAGEEAQLSAAHCAYFLAFAVSHNPERARGVVIEEPRLLDLEHDNLRAALRWSCVEEPESALRLAASLWRFWFVRGHAVEGAAWVERALAASPAPSRPRAAALIGLAGLDSRLGRSDRHRALGAEALAIVRQVGDPDEIVAARLVEAALTWCTFDLDEAEQLTAAVRTRAVAHGRPEHVAAASWLSGQCALSREDGPTATRHFNACLTELTQCRSAPAPFLPVITASLQLVHLAGRLVPCFEETLLLGRRVGAIQGAGFALSALGDAARLSGDQQSAIAAISDVVEQFARLKDDLASGQVLHQLGCVLRDAGDHGAAREALSSARRLRLGVGDRRGQFLTEIHLALLDAMEGDVERGIADARRCLSRFESVGDQPGMGGTLTVLAAIELIAGRLSAARELYRWAAELFVPWRRHAGWARLMVAELSTDLGDPHRAARETALALAAFHSTRCLVADDRLAALRGRWGDSC